MLADQSWIESKVETDTTKKILFHFFFLVFCGRKSKYQKMFANFYWHESQSPLTFVL